MFVIVKCLEEIFLSNNELSWSLQIGSGTINIANSSLSKLRDQAKQTLSAFVGFSRAFSLPGHALSLLSVPSMTAFACLTISVVSSPSSFLDLS